MSLFIFEIIAEVITNCIDIETFNITTKSLKEVLVLHRKGDFLPRNDIRQTCFDLIHLGGVLEKATTIFYNEWGETRCQTCIRHQLNDQERSRIL